MNKPQTQPEEKKSPAQEGMKIVFWIILGLAILTVCVGLPLTSLQG